MKLWISVIVLVCLLQVIAAAAHGPTPDEKRLLKVAQKLSARLKAHENTADVFRSKALEAEAHAALMSDESAKLARKSASYSEDANRHFDRANDIRARMEMIRRKMNEHRQIVQAAKVEQQRYIAEVKADKEAINEDKRN